MFLISGNIVSTRLPALILLSTILAGCNGEIYVRDGVTDGDTFYLAERALADSDPVLQTWVSYSLARSACQLQIGGDNPARTSSFDCELTARRLMLDTWSEKKAWDPAMNDLYLDQLSLVSESGYLDEYVVRHYRKDHWQIPDGLDLTSYTKWARRNIPGHNPEMRIIGSWNYARNVSGF